MITEREKEIILRCAKKYNASSVFLFGSSIEKDTEVNDIDLGIKGVNPRLFFKFYAELFKHFSKPLDVVDLSQKSLFNDIVEKTGVKIYG